MKKSLAIRWLVSLTVFFIVMIKLACQQPIDDWYVWSFLILYLVVVILILSNQNLVRVPSGRKAIVMEGGRWVSESMHPEICPTVFDPGDYLVRPVADRKVFLYSDHIQSRQVLRFAVLMRKHDQWIWLRLVISWVYTRPPTMLAISPVSLDNPVGKELVDSIDDIFRESDEDPANIYPQAKSWGEVIKKKASALIEQRKLPVALVDVKLVSVGSWEVGEKPNPSENFCHVIAHQYSLPDGLMPITSKASGPNLDSSGGGTVPDWCR